MGAAQVESIGIGSKAWGQKIRKNAQELAKDLDTGYVALGRILWTVFNTPIDGDPKKNAIFVSWGYQTFRDYAEGELGLHHKKAERLRAIGEVLDVKLAGTPKELRDRFVALGWSKARELARFFRIKSDNKTVESWIERAEQCNYPELMASLKKAMDKIDKLADGTVVEAGAEEEEEEEPESDAGDFNPDEISSAPKSEKGKTKKKPDPEGEDAILPDVDRSHMFSFLCFNEHIDTVREALERAEELAKARSNDPKKSLSKTSLLSLICLDFLATNTFGKKGDLSARKHMLAKLQLHLGVKLIAVEDGQVVFGLPTLKKLAEA